MMWLWLACFRPSSYTCDPPGTQVVEPRAAGCVTVDAGRLLLVQGTSGRWTIPGGYLEPGEDSAAAAARETLEESGVVVQAGAPMCAVPANRFVAHTCVAAPSATPSADGNETRDARWMTRDEIQALEPSALRFPEQKASYLRFLD